MTYALRRFSGARAGLARTSHREMQAISKTAPNSEQ